MARTSDGLRDSRLAQAWDNGSRRIRVGIIYLGLLLIALFVVVTPIGFARLEAQGRSIRAQAHRADVLTQKLEDVVDDNVAQQCVQTWSRTEGIRNGDEHVYRRNAETLIALSAQNPNTNPAIIAAYRAQVELDVAEIRAQTPDPACDLEAAQLRLGDGS